ncbi:MAG: circularly permuted type 2 ATP-grasp protein [Actinobacteria bacterium]|nr:circularly permuted type 2 ATP-grasp protein [Actinomycetota bacterium]
MFTSSGEPRPTHSSLLHAIQALGVDGLKERGRLRDGYLDQQGITFTLSGKERPLPLDLVPRIITHEEWKPIEAGVKQRIRALEAFLADLYGPQECLSDGVIPRKLVLSSTHYHRAAYGITPPNNVRLHVSGIDLIRDEDGRFRVLEDNLRNPSGVSYVLENRRALAHVLPEVFGGHRVRQVEEYPERLLDALQAAAPKGVDEPVVVVMTPGVHNSAHYEHAFLALRMGVELVEGRDMYCRDGFLWMRTTSGPQRVHVVFRRIDDEFLDPVQFRHDSVLGVPGLLNAARLGHVTIANAVGNGVADDKAVYPHVPELIRYYLDEEPILPNVDTYDLEDADQREFVLGQLDRMVLKPSDGSGGYGLVIGTKATEQELEEARGKVLRDPRGWIAQPIVNFSTAPTAVGDASLGSRHVDLRPFAVNSGDDIYVLPGGLTRVALPEGSLVVNSSQGGGSKDTWVLEEGGGVHRSLVRPVRRVRRASGVGMSRMHSPRVHDERRQQQEAQQQQSRQQSGGGPC